MKRMAVCIAVLLVSSLAWAGSKTYQATGPVVDVRDDAIVVDKGKEGKWEIARDANIRLGWRGVATGMIVNENDRGSARLNRRFEHLTRMDENAVQRAL